MWLKTGMGYGHKLGVWGLAMFVAALSGFGAALWQEIECFCIQAYWME